MVFLLELELIGRAVLGWLSTEEVAVQRRVLHGRRHPGRDVADPEGARV
ncbi:hypothetical protein [Kutzneria chonburiensis]|uniref:Uncharacterized protein n=1 Tax=Kutzneria chonburiensis TaxID=1483604 RepID=A0ABV6N5F1_9PSEU|nr:hypothetical protein [Kutzneria chonburiensis]